ncbi:MAG: ABC transporter permease subunit, partial [Myxococcales bacterium]|nr:ABC transporter permease subunit [Myxococcales bacterium]
LAACAMVTLLVTASLLGALLWGMSSETAPMISPWPLLAASLSVAVMALVVAVPLGLLAAIHLAEFASPGQRRVLGPLFDLLANVPTIVFAYLALTWVTPGLQRLLPGLGTFNLLSPGIVIGVMISPMLASLGAASLAAVPRSLREAAWALGADEVRTIVRVVLPAAAPGLAAAILLVASRAIGETMIVTLAAAPWSGAGPGAGLDPLAPAETLSAHIVVAAMDGGAGAGQGVFLIAALLFIVTLGLNLVARRLLRRTNGGRG